MGLLCIISSNKQIKYETEEKNTDWLSEGSWYNTTICSKLHGTVFEDLIRNYKTGRYNIMCYINAHYRQQTTYVYDAISAGGRAMLEQMTY